jgi:CDP-diacylglycerol--serine O-phosphatidyltransferase
MNKLIHAPRRLARRLVSPLRPPRAGVWLASQPGFAVPADAVVALHGAQAFRQALLEGIAQATRRIVIVALYLQDDAAGREVMDALHAAHAHHPPLEIDV